MQILKKEVREKIEQTASSEFLQKGYEGASMRAIAKKSSISVGNLYNYFKSKEDLFYSLTKTSYRYLIKLLSEVKKHGPEDGFTNREFTESLVTKISELLKKHRAGFLLMMDKGQGTKYQDLKDELITVLLRHFEEELLVQKRSEDSLILRIAAKNLV